MTDHTAASQDRDVTSAMLDVLAAMLPLYQRLLTLGEEKRRVLVRGDVAALQDIVKEEEKLVYAAGTLERRRAALQAALPEPDLTLPAWAATLAEPARSRATAVARELGETVSRLQRLNEINTRLVEHSLRFVHYSLSLLTHLAAPAVYSPGTDAAVAGPVQGLIDRKI